MTRPGPGVADRAAVRATLRLLATSDLHVHVFPYDYYADRPVDTVGLARTAALIAAARREVPNCLLFDNGDFLLGNPMGDHAVVGSGPHPMIAAMNAVGYDAVALGNHEFDYGLDRLGRALAGAAFPVTCANLTDTAGAPLAGTAPWLILPRRITDSDGRTHPVDVGVIGVVPPQVMQWDGRHLAGRAQVRDMVDAVQDALPAMRRAGAEVIVALAHSGIGPALPIPGMENAATAIAGLEGVDAVIAGHSHLVFPGPGWDGMPGVDGAAGTLQGRPAVMPGFWGSHLGLIDLDLRYDGGQWRARGGRSSVRAIAGRRPDWTPVPLVASVPAVLNAAVQDHAATLRHIRRPVGRTEVALQTFFALVADVPSVQVVARAQADHVRAALAGTDYAGLPVLSAAAPFRAGGRAGPSFYTDIPAGDLALRHLAELYQFPNMIRAVLTTGAGVAEWLERSAAAFRRIVPGLPDQPLLDAGFPGYNVDSLLGVTYRIDPSQPARYDGAGRLADPAARRIRDLSLDGVPLDPGAAVIVATNSYRIGGGGGFPGLASDDIALEGHDTNLDVLVAHLARRGVLRAERRLTWRFAALPGTSVTFDSAAVAARHLDTVPQLAIEPAGDGDKGFARFRIHL